jgi:uncharacterized protein
MQENTLPTAPLPEQPLIIPVKNPNKKLFIIIGVLVGLLLLLLVLLILKTPGKKAGMSPVERVFAPLVSPTPFPFRELTVPYLREREYKSSLGQIELYSQNGNYTSYLTSYDSDGLKINGLLTKPLGDQPQNGWPAVVFIHGYIPPTLYSTTDRYTDHVDYLARNGFVVFKIDLRGHGDSEGTPGGGYFGSDYVIDALNAYAALQSTDFVNKEAIGMWGHSMAGNILLRAFVSHRDIPAIVIWAGAVYSYEDRDKYGINDNSYRPPTVANPGPNRRQELMQKYGSPSAASEFWKQVIPTNYLADSKGAIQLNHAVNDDVVNIGYSRDLMTLLDKTTITHELWEYSNGGHNIEGVSFDEAMTHTVEFFKKYLQ